jgi:hypothetical protein
MQSIHVATRAGLAAGALFLAVALGAPAQAGVVHFEGFEDPAWVPGGDNWNNLSGGDIERVASGGGIAGATSSSGSAHAQITNLSENNDVFGNPSLGALSPFTRFGGYSSTFGGGFSTSLDIYLDPSWDDSQGFDYSVAANRQNGNHLRDFIFHVGVVDGDLLVNGSNNSDLAFNASKLENNNGGFNFTVTDAGWYTFEHVFRDDGGVLAVDLNLYDDSHSLLYTITRSNPADDIATTVGGNRYGWLVYNNIDGLAIDNTVLSTPDVPEPATLALFGLGLAGLGVTRRRRKA